MLNFMNRNVFVFVLAVLKVDFCSSIPELQPHNSRKVSWYFAGVHSWKKNEEKVL